MNVSSGTAYACANPYCFHDQFWNLLDGEQFNLSQTFDSLNVDHNLNDAENMPIHDRNSRKGIQPELTFSKLPIASLPGTQTIYLKCADNTCKAQIKATFKKTHWEVFQAGVHSGHPLIRPDSSYKNSNTNEYIPLAPIATRNEEQAAFSKVTHVPQSAPAHSLFTGDMAISQGTINPRRRGRYQGDGYFDSYSNMEVHCDMLQDRVRTEAYRTAILTNREMFQGKVVLDVGCGTGILSLFCLEAGARCVHAVDASDMAMVAAKVAQANGYGGDRFAVYHSKVENLTLPVDHVDIIVSEWMGYACFYESMLDSVLFARDKWLAPGGRMFPERVALRCAALSDPAYQHNTIDFWENIYGYRMWPAGHKARRLLETAQVRVRPASNLLTDAACVASFDLLHVPRNHIADGIPQTRFEAQFLNTAPLTGFIVWFDTYFPTPGSSASAHDPNAPPTLATALETPHIPAIAFVPEEEPLPVTAAMTFAPGGGTEGNMVNIEEEEDEKIVLKKEVADGSLQKYQMNQVVLSTGPHAPVTHWSQTCLPIANVANVTRDESVEVVFSMKPKTGQNRFYDFEVSYSSSSVPKTTSKWEMTY